MNADQKQRIAQAVSNWRSYDLQEAETVTENELSAMCSSMTALLQELIDAPEVDPVAKVTGYYGGYLSISTIDGRVLPAGTALFTAPPAPSVPEGWMRAIDEALVVHHIGIADSSDGYEEAKKKLNELLAINSDIARDCSEPPADLVRDAELLDWLQNNFYHRQMSDWDARQRSGQNMWVFFAPKNVQSDVREVLRAAIAAEKGGTR